MFPFYVLNDCNVIYYAMMSVFDWYHAFST
jgi:hypothetical protein